MHGCDGDLANVLEAILKEGEAGADGGYDLGVYVGGGVKTLARTISPKDRTGAGGATLVRPSAFRTSTSAWVRPMFGSTSIRNCTTEILVLVGVLNGKSSYQRPLGSNHDRGDRRDQFCTPKEPPVQL